MYLLLMTHTMPKIRFKDATSAQRAGRTSTFVRLALLLAALLGLSSCTTTSSTSAVGSRAGQLSPTVLNNPAVKARNAQIALEAPGDYYIGRRWWTEGTRFWGYLRRPGQPWSEAQLVIMNEYVMRQPDRIPEVGAAQSHGYDQNYEYRIWGTFTGKKIYDPNSNFEIPEFQLTKYEVINQNPGFLFYPSEGYSSKRLPPVHPPYP
jgi:hypothetical protein